LVGERFLSVITSLETGTALVESLFILLDS
jgi:hypothetical protein